MNSPKFSLIVHGGAWDIPAAAIPDCRAGIRHALEAGREILARDGAAMDAVEAAIIVLEDDVTFDAGTGAHLNRDGRVQLDAIIMDGASLKAGAVAAVERIKNPIRLARKVLESSEHMMSLAQARSYSLRKTALLGAILPSWSLIASAGLGSVAGKGIKLLYSLSDKHGTVGAVARDVHRQIVAATSTGGTCCKFPGRVGDSPLIGCGCYAERRRAVSPALATAKRS